MSSKLAGGCLVVASIAIAVVFCVIAGARSLTGLENVLLQVFSLALGLIGSYIYGRESARDAARELVKPHARSALRRLLSLYRSLGRLAAAIQGARPAVRNAPIDSRVLDVLEGIVVEQISTADDALEDWRDIVPEDLKQLRGQVTMAEVRP